MFATESRLAPGDTVMIPDIWPNYLTGNTFARCPGGGNYTLQPVGTVPTCTLGTLAGDPHKLF